MNYRDNALPKRQPRFWCEVIVICIVVLLAWLIEAWGHGEGRCLTDVDGNVRLSNDGWMKIIRHLEGEALKNYDDKHGHRNQYYDSSGNPAGESTSFFAIDFNDTTSEFYADRDRYHANCPTTTQQPPTPQPRPNPTPSPTTTQQPPTPQPRPNPTPSPQQQFSIVVISGPGSGAPGDTLTFAVEVLQDGRLTQDLTVDFSITPSDANASLGSTRETTDSNGQAQTTLILGSNASGSYTITATSNGVPVSATATVEDSQRLPTPAFSIRVVTSPGSGAPGDTLTFAVEVLQDGRLTKDLTVDFSITPSDKRVAGLHKRDD